MGEFAFLSAGSMVASHPSLDAVRAEIDALDERIHDALIARAELVAAVRAAKGADGPILRPGREANVIRRLLARHRGGLPRAVIVRIWREIMTAASRMQGRFAIAAAASAAGGAGVELARDHFGGLTAVIALASPAQALSALADGRAQIALLPLPEDCPDQPWWRGCGAGAVPQLNILARVPVVPERGGGAALLVGPQGFDPSVEDRGYLVVETRTELSQARLSAVVDRAGLGALRFPAAIDDAAIGSLQLVEIDRYVPPGDERLARIAAELGAGTHLRSIGGYAVPDAVLRG